MKIWNLRAQKNLNIEKIIFKVVQMKFLAMHITNKNSFDLFIVKHFTKYLHGTWSLPNILMIFGIKERWIIFEPYNVFLAIATNISQWFKTGFVVQGHIWHSMCTNCYITAPTALNALFENWGQYGLSECANILYYVRLSEYTYASGFKYELLNLEISSPPH